MSVDIVRLSEHLPPSVQRSLKAEFAARAKSPTTAFLLCFFLGIFGAHRFYLGQPTQGVIRLVLSPLVVPGLIWELVDLFRIDGEVYQRNLKLAEEIVARAALAQPNPALEAEALSRLDAVIGAQEAAQQPIAAPATGVTGVQPEPVSLSYPSAARDQEGLPASPNTPPRWPIAAEVESALAAETASLAWPAESAGTTDRMPTNGVPVELMGAEPGLAASDAADAGSAGEPSSPLSSASAPDLVAEESATDTTDAIVGAEAYAMPTPMVDVVPLAVSTNADLASSGSVGVTVRPATEDHTDRAWEPGAPLVADVGEWGSTSVRVEVAVPDVPAADADAEMRETEEAASWVATALPPLALDPPPGGGADGPDSETPLVAEIHEAPEGPEPEELPTLILYPDDAAAAHPSWGRADDTAVATDEGAAEAMSAEDVAESTSSPQASASAPLPSAKSGQLGQAGQADQPGHDEAQVMEELHDQPAEGARRVVKRVRVVRRLVVNGQVIQETSAEQVVDPDADTDATAMALRASLGSAVPQSLAELASPPAAPVAPSAEDQLPHSPDLGN